MRYFFHVLNQVSYVRDEVGCELSGIHSARNRAANSAGEILTSDLRDGNTDIAFDVQVEDDTGGRVLTLHIEGKVARTGTE